MDHPPRTRPATRRLTAVAAILGAAALAAGCGSGSSGSSGASGSPSPTDAQGQVSSALSQAGQSASSALSSLGSQAGGAVSSAVSQASASASSALAQVKGGIDATADVQVGAVTTDSDGRATAQLTVQNPTSDQHDYTISVSFKNSGGTLQDIAAVSVDAVPAGGTKTATARSNRSLSGVTAEVSIALRH